MKRNAGILLILGSLMALIGAFMPISTKVFGEAENAAEQTAFIEANESEWAVSSSLFGLGGLVAVAGLGLFAVYLRDTDTESNLKLATNVSFGMTLIGAVLWAIICYNRIALPASEATENLNIHEWMFTIYTLFTAAAQVVLGFVLTRIGFRRVGWGVLVLGAVSGLLFIAISDHFPLLHYVIFLPMGVVFVMPSSVE